MFFWFCDATNVGEGQALASGRREAMMTTLAFDSLRFARKLRDADGPAPRRAGAPG